jgi:hypothetical protein
LVDSLKIYCVHADRDDPKDEQPASNH